MYKNVKQQSKLSSNKILIIVVIVVLLISFANIDDSRIQKDKYPLFAMNLVTLKDGGTKYFLGVGYGVLVWKQIAKGSKNGVIVDGYKVGKEYVPFPECYTLLIEGNYVPNIDLEFAASE